MASTKFLELGQTPIGEPIKQLFRSDISPRRLAYIETLADLLIVLKAQYLLNRNNIEALKPHLSPDCQLFVDERHLQLGQLNGVAGQNVYSEMCHMENNQSDLEPTQQQFRTTYENTYYDVPPTRIPTKPQPTNLNQSSHVFEQSKVSIYRLIAEDIGKKWRALGRELNVREGQLDRIDEEHRGGNTADKVYAVLALFAERTHGPSRQAEALALALRMINRRDLETEMHAMLSTHE